MNIHTKRIKLSDFRQSYFADNSRPCLPTLVSHIQNGRLSGEKIGSRWYVIVTTWGEPLYYGQTVQSPVRVSTGNKIADRILKQAAA